ncbi:MAG: phage portal protein [Flavonifractor sp.]|nr:phage portal protein [Flavonifractor sp.]
MIFDRGIRKAPRAAGRVMGPLSLSSPQGWTVGDESTLSREGAMKISTVNRCVELRSASAAVLPVYVMNENSKERLTGHRLGRVLWERPNEAMTRFDYEKLMGCHKLLRGNAYAWIVRDPASAGPVELIPLPPDCVTPYLDRAGRLWYLFFHPNTGQLTRLSPADVLHYKEYSEDGIAGISVLRRAAQTIRAAQAAQEYETDVYANGGRPSGVLTAEADLNGDTTVTLPDGSTRTVRQKDFLRQEWESVHSGPGKRFRVAVLDLGLKYQPIAMNNADVQFVESKEIRVADVCRFFGVPLHLVYAGKQSYDSNEQNSIEFVKYTLQPDVTPREQEDTGKLLLPFERARGERVKREMKVFLRGDTAAQAAWYKALREVGAYSVDDIRALEDLPNVPGGGGRYASWNYGPLETWGELSALRAVGSPQDKG